jgi:hypothetical protein
VPGERHVQGPAHLCLLLLLRPAGCLGAASAGSMRLGEPACSGRQRTAAVQRLANATLAAAVVAQGRGRAAGCTPRIAHPLPKGRPVTQLRALSLHSPLPWPGGAAQTCWSWLARVCSCRAACLVCAGRSPWLPPHLERGSAKKNNSAAAGLWGPQPPTRRLCAQMERGRARRMLGRGLADMHAGHRHLSSQWCGPAGLSLLLVQAASKAPDVTLRVSGSLQEKRKSKEAVQ